MDSASQQKELFYKIHPGKSWPLGSSITSKGVNFSIAAPELKALELLIFRNYNDSEPYKIYKLDSKNRSGDYLHIEIEGIGEGCCYGYRVCAVEDLIKNKFLSNKLLLDPCARAIGGWDVYKRLSKCNSSSNIDKSLKGIVCERNKFDFNKYPRPKHKWRDTIIYELHIGAFTKHDESGIDDMYKGTFLGLIDKIDHFKKLGITTIELLPVYCFDPTDSPHGLKNFWGYSPINWFTPHFEYVAGNDPLEARNQFRELIAECHRNNIEVILDVVYNHTSEGNQEGPCISWKGLGESTYYYKNNIGQYLDVSGCGNSINANNPLTRKLILESMICWSTELGVDGFRFDLGVALSRGKNLTPLDNPPLFEEIESDPYLSDLKLTSEPWDCGGLYKLEDFPAQKIGTWNGHFRDDIRKFWKGEKHSVWPLKDRLRGSKELYKHNKSKQEKSINFITAHDGFTLHDLVSYETKHNFSNGEDNRDGENHNNSWNNGIEGPSLDLDIKHLRERQKKSLLATLLLSPGVPMLLMGDEYGRSQGGNNNSWCQDSPLGWMIWPEGEGDIQLFEFIKKVIFIRKRIPDFFSSIYLHSDNLNTSALGKQSLWVQWHGVNLNQPDWGSWSHTISYSINNGKNGAVMWLGLNGYTKSMMFNLPKPIGQWEEVINTAQSLKNSSTSTNNIYSKDLIELKQSSLVLMLNQEYASRLKG